MNKELNQQIQTIENLITNAKLSLKSWAKQIGQYHTQLKELSSQLASLKEQIIMNTKNNNNPNNQPNTQGGKK